MLLSSARRLALLAACFIASSPAQDGAVDPSFAPQLRQPGSVDFIRVEPGGIILLGGQFKFINGTPANGVARLTSTGAVSQVPQVTIPAGQRIRVLDRFSDGGLLVLEFQPGRLNGVIRRLRQDGSQVTDFGDIPVLHATAAALVLPDDRFLVSAVVYTPDQITYLTLDRFALLRRFLPSGQLDPSFPTSPGLLSIGDAGFQGRLIGLADGRFYSAGSYRQTAGNVVTERFRIVRFLADGTIDPTFEFTPANPTDYLVAHQPDGRLLAVNQTGPSYFLRRLSATGAIDAAPFQSPAIPGSRADAFQVAALDNGRILLAGSESNTSLIQLLEDGTIDSTYQARVSGPGNAVVVPDQSIYAGLRALTAVSGGRALIGGTFFRAGGKNSIGVALLGTDGTAAPTFQSGSGAEFAGGGGVISLAVDAQDRVVFTGSFSSVDGFASPQVARLLASGAVDTSFQSGGPLDARAMLVRLLNDGSMVLLPLAGPPIRLTSQGQLDPGFLPAGALLPPPTGATSPMLTDLFAASNRSLYLAGEFRPNRSGGPGRYGLARLLGSTGALDEAFHAGLGAEIPLLTQNFVSTSVAGADNGVVYWGGYDFQPAVGFVARLLRLDATGQHLPDFQPDLPFQDARVIVPQADGKILVGARAVSSGISADLERFYRILRGPQVARVNLDGSIDATFRAPPAIENSFGVNTVLTQPDGRVLVSGYFHTLGGRQRRGVARLQANGALDDSFDPGSGPTYSGSLDPSSTGIGPMSAQASGALIIGGLFDRFSGTARTDLVRLLNQNAPPVSVPRGRLINVSTRAHVGAGERVAIAGFVLQGSGTRRIVVRALGPSLAAFGLTGLLPNPRLRLVNAAGQEVAVNDNWRDGDPIGLGEFGLRPTDDNESAIVATLPAGAYTALVDDPAGTQGNALVEVYDIAADGPARVVNLSTRAVAHAVVSDFPQLPGENPNRPSALIGGFVIRGGPCRVLVRSLGPSLTPFGIVNAEPDPRITLRSPDAPRLERMNLSWQSQDVSEDAVAVQSSGFAPGNQFECAVVVELPEGSYTAVIEPGFSAAAGVATVEIYELP